MLTIKRLLYNVYILFEKREGHSRLERNLHEQIQYSLLMSLGKHDVELSCKVMKYYLCFQNEIENGEDFKPVSVYFISQTRLKGSVHPKTKFFFIMHLNTQKRYSEECWVQTVLHNYHCMNKIK